MRNAKQQQAGFTLLELLVVVAVIGVLVGLLLVGVQQVRESANRMACQNNMRQLTLAVHNYEAARGTMPPYATGLPGTPPGNWFMYMAGFVEQGSMDGSVTPLPPALSNIGMVGGQSNLQFKVLTCPSDPSTRLETYWGKTSYLANWYAFGDGKTGTTAWFPPPQPFANLTSGLSNVVLFAEAYAYCDNLPRLALETPWYHTFGITQQGLASDDPSYAPTDYTMFQVRPDPVPPGSCDKLRTQTPHRTMNVALADGSVRPVGGSISPATWKQSLKPNNPTPLPGDW